MKTIRYVFLVLVFFPSVTFGILSAEIFPWAILFALVSIRHFRKDEELLTFLLLMVLFCSALWSFTFYPESDAFRSLMAYFNPILVFIAFLSMPPIWVERSIDLARKLLVFMLALGISQYLGLLQPIEGILKILVPRASGGALFELGGRGVTLLSTEPSRAGVELVLLYFLWRMTSQTKIRSGIGDLAFLAYLVLIIKAAQPMAFAVLVIGFLLVRRPVQVVFVFLAFLLTPLVGLDFNDTRVLTLLSRVLAESSFSGALFFLVSESGPRLISIYAFFLSGFVHPIGLGVGSWPIASIQAINDSGFDVSRISYFRVLGNGGVFAVRGSGMISNMMLDVGILGTGLFIYWIFCMTRRFRVRDRNTMIVMLILFFKISFIGSVGEPLPWVVAALILRYNAIKNANAQVDRKIPPNIRTTLQHQP